MVTTTPRTSHTATTVRILTEWFKLAQHACGNQSVILPIDEDYAIETQTSFRLKRIIGHDLHVADHVFLRETFARLLDNDLTNGVVFQCHSTNTDDGGIGHAQRDRASTLVVFLLSNEVVHGICSVRTKMGAMQLLRTIPLREESEDIRASGVDALEA